MDRSERIAQMSGIVGQMEKEYGITPTIREAPTPKKKRKPGLLDRAKGLLGQRKTYISPNLRGENRKFMEEMAKEPK